MSEILISESEGTASAAGAQRAEGARGPRGVLTICLAVLLIGVYALELGLHATRTSVTYDEPVFMFAGYHFWKCNDHGINPENPPLLSLVAAIPLRGKALAGPTPLCPDGFTTKYNEYVQAMQFLVANGIDPVVIPARFAAMGFSLALAVLMFVAARRMFGDTEALIALALLAFEPNMIAHGSLVTTDMAATAMFFASVVIFFLYWERPAIWKIAALGLTLGAMLATKHSALPAAIFMWVLMLVAAWRDSHSATDAGAEFSARVGRGAAALGAATAIAYVCLWASYGFHFYAIPRLGQQALPPTALDPGTAGVPGMISSMTQLARSMRVLPEAYLFGITDVLRQNMQHPTYLFGRVYPHGLWYYFPVAFAVKTSLPLLLLLVAASVALIWQRDNRRAVLFLAVPAICYFAFTLTSGLDIGIRHLLPVYPFFILLAAAGACSLGRQAPKAWVGIIALLVLGGVDSARTFPNYISFSNELWGGTTNTYKILSDSNVDWGQNLKQIRSYIAANNVRDCWIAAPGTPDIALATLPCHLLPARYQWIEHPMDDVGESITGTVFLSNEDLPAEFPGRYDAILAQKPTAFIGGTTFVYDGTFDVKQVAVDIHSSNSQFYYRHGMAPQAIGEMRDVVTLDPGDPRAHCALAVYLKIGGQNDDARREFGTCLQLTGQDPDAAPLRQLAQQQLQSLPQ